MPHGNGMPASMTSVPGLGFAPVHGNGVPPVAPPARDDTTRYLCAAAQLDEEYADEAIREFLLERTRQIPPSPGVDAAAVLGEAVAARARRKFRDWLLIVLMSVFVLVAPTVVLIGWIVLALPAYLTERRIRLRPKWIMTALGIGALLIVLHQAGIFSPARFLPSGHPSGNRLAAGVLLIVLMLTVLLADEIVLWRLLFVRFQPGRDIRAVGNRPVYAFASATVRENLRSYTRPHDVMADSPARYGTAVPEGLAKVIVYRSYQPFVGAGTAVNPWSITVPLERRGDVARPRRLTTDELYATIAAAVGSLSRATALAPSMRLAGLAFGEQIVVSAKELIDHLAEPEARDFLAGLGQRPYTLLRPERVRELRANPLEWARYYQYHRLETWDRDVVVSVFVHVAVDDGALYVEWTPCVLRPIRKRYHDLDSMSQSASLPLGRSLLRLVQLPASLPSRLSRAVSTIGAPRREPNDPDRYGAACSLRELAQGRRMHNYLQLLDKARYLKVMQSRLVLAVSRFLSDAGYSAASFDSQAATVINNNVQIGDVQGNVVTVGSQTGDVNIGTGNEG